MIRRWAWVALLIFVLDQASKYAVVHLIGYAERVAVLPFFNVTLLYNPGAAFGFLRNAGGWQNALFVVIALLVAAAVLRVIHCLNPSDRTSAVALMLVLGGAFGNLADRLRLGHVVDFIDLHYGSWHFYTFNVADAAITTGAVLLALDALAAGARRSREDGPHA